MTNYQFADIGKDLCRQIKVIQSLVKGKTFKEAAMRLSTAEATCENLESLMKPDNELQRRIVNNRRLDISMLHDAIQGGLKISRRKPVQKRTVK
jgi:hypothetical protein